MSGLFYTDRGLLYGSMARKEEGYCETTNNKKVIVYPMILLFPCSTCSYTHTTVVMLVD